MMKTSTLLLTSALILTIGCLGPLIEKNQTNQTTMSTQTVTKDTGHGSQNCPGSCDDRNHCTYDYCNESSDYECAHRPVTPCCGNQECENTETCLNCPQDCGMCGQCPQSCDDFNTCTWDHCGSTTGFKCAHEFTDLLTACEYKDYQENQTSVFADFAVEADDILYSASDCGLRIVATHLGQVESRILRETDRSATLIDFPDGKGILVRVESCEEDRVTFTVDGNYREPQHAIVLESRNYSLGEKIRHQGEVVATGELNGSIYMDGLSKGWTLYKYQNTTKPWGYNRLTTQLVCEDAVCPIDCQENITCAPPQSSCEEAKLGWPINFEWDQTIYKSVDAECPNATKNCMNKTQVTPGKYKIEFCYSLEKTGELGGYCYPSGDEYCISREFWILED